MGLEGERKRVRQMGILSGGDAVGKSFGSAWSVPVAHTSTYHIPTSDNRESLNLFSYVEPCLCVDACKFSPHSKFIQVMTDDG